MFRIIFIFLLMSYFGCQKQEIARQFTEIVIPAENHPQSSLAWDLPPGWTQESGDQMRLVTFRLSSNPEAFDCSVVSLPGGAGGLEANLKRWMGQIGLQVTDELFNQFMEESKDHVFDFSSLQQGQDISDESMIAAMIHINGSIIFVKLKGSISSVKQYKPDFLKLVRSIRVQ